MDASEFTRNFESALERLDEFAGLPIVNERDRAGIVKAFEFTFEQAWKSIQKFAQAQGLDCRFPKESIQRGMEMGIVSLESEQSWLQMLKDRNVTSHVYRQDIVHEVSDRIVAAHAAELRRVLTSLKEFATRP
ncbi:MAG: HI0074 family nucleotidyltransferase substrate-binding subunit [Candidatus Hydrogenedentota bacterium]